MAEFDTADATAEELATGSLAFWTEWLKGAVSAYFSRTSIENRLEAFSPLAVHPESLSPAGDITLQLEKIGRNAVRVAPKAVTEVLRTWSLGRDGLEGASLLLELGIHIGSLSLFAPFGNLLDQAAQMSAKAQREIAFLVAEAAGQNRLRRTEIAGLLPRLGRLEAVPPTVIADVIVGFTSGSAEHLHTLPSELLEIFPDLEDSSFGGDMLSAVARKLQFRFQELDLRMALSAHQKDGPEAATLRHRLRGAVFPMESYGDETDFQIDDQTREEFAGRTGIVVVEILPPEDEEGKGQLGDRAK